MGNCKTCLLRNKGPERKYTLAILGLDNAGKTVTAKGLQGESPDLVAPTLGFSNIDFKLDKNDVTMFDLGGGKRIRDIWTKYLAEVYGIIYVVDSSDSGRLDECREVLKKLLEHPQVTGKPILLLANKQDCPGALDEIEVCEHLNLESLVNINKCPCRVETCSAVLGYGKKLDTSILAGVRWLIATIESSWEKLDVRVQEDIKEKKEIMRKEREEKMERIRINKEEREKKKREKGYDSEEDEDENDGPIDGDPFKTVNIAELEKKEARLKEKKRQRKATEQQQAQESRSSHHNDDDDDDSDEVVPRTTRSLDSPKLRRPKQGENRPGSPSPTHLRKGSYSPPLGRPQRSSGYGRFSNDDEDYTKSQWPKKATPRPESPSVPTMSPHLSRRSLDALGLEDGMSVNRRLSPLTPLGKLEPLESYEKKGKKKKKKAKKNQTTPSDSDDLELDEKNHQSWEPSTRSMYKASKSPRLDPLEEPENENDSFSTRWGLAEELALSSNNRYGPNSEYDDIVT